MTDQIRPFYDAARAIYPLLPAWYEYTTEDAPNPEFRGLNAGGLPIFNVPPGTTLFPDQGAHEAGHAYMNLVQKQSSRDYLAEYWTFRGFPGTWKDAVTESWATTGMAAWQLDPRESWAEAFARSVVTDHNEKTMTYGKDMNPLLLRAFFTSIDGISAATLPPPIAPTTTVVTATTRYCFDSTTARDIPAGVSIVAGYIDGLYKWSDADWALFPDSVKVRIACFSDTNDGHVGDVEAGDMTPAAGVAWVQMRRAAGIDPTIYCGLGQWGAVVSAFERAGVAPPHYWIAHYDNDPTPISGAIAKQYANPTWTGKHYDVSVVTGRWPGVEEDDVAFKDDADAQQFKNDMLSWQKAVNERLALDAHHKHDVNLNLTVNGAPTVSEPK